MPRKTIAKLEATLAEIRELREIDRSLYQRVVAEHETIKKRLAQVGAENEGLRQDIRWFKALIQNLTSSDRGPR